MELLFAGVGLALIISGILGDAVSGAGWGIPAPKTPIQRLVIGGLGVVLIVVALVMAGKIPIPNDGPDGSPSSPASSAKAGSSSSPNVPTSSPSLPTPSPSLPTVAPPQASGPWRGMPARFNDGIDAALVRDVGFMYFFDDDQYVRFDDLSSGKTAGPITTSGNFHGMPADFARGIDAACTNSAGQIYFFRDDRYIRFTDLTKNATAPVVTAENWRGLPVAFRSKLDAAMTDEAGRIYFFRGDQYVRFTKVINGVDPGYPKSIASRWTGMPETFDAGIDAAMMTNSGVTFFFKGADYVRFSAGRTDVDAGYPKRIGS